MPRATIDTITELDLKNAWPALGRQNRLVVYLALVKGLRDSEIAVVLECSYKTVREHLYQAYVKAKARTARQAHAFYAIRFFQERSGDAAERFATAQKGKGASPATNTQEDSPSEV